MTLRQELSRLTTTQLKTRLRELDPMRTSERQTIIRLLNERAPAAEPARPNPASKVFPEDPMEWIDSL